MHLKSVLHILISRQQSSRTKTKTHEIPGRSWESVRADIFTINNKCYHCIVDYHSNFLVIKQVEGFSADNLIQTCKIICSEYGLLSKIVSHIGTKLLSEKLKTSASNLPYIMLCHHLTIIKVMNKHKHAYLF